MTKIKIEVNTIYMYTYINVFICVQVCLIATKMKAVSATYEFEENREISEMI